LHPSDEARQPYVAQMLGERRGPVVASTDYIRAVPDQIRQWVNGSGHRYRTLGTDGYGRSDYRKALRRFFEVDRWYVTVAALHELAAEGTISPDVVAAAIEKYGIDADAPMPTSV
jgi:pyruvate dehydrogenase E1 component